MRWIVGVSALLVVGIAIGAGSQSKTNDAGTTGTTTQGGAVSGTDTLTTSSSSSSSLAVWAATYGQSDSSMIGDDLGTVGTDAKAMDTSSMAVDCRTLQRDLVTVESHLPTPRADLTSALDEAYSDYSKAASACIAGVTTLDTDQLTQVSTYLTMGGSAIDRATSILRSINGD